MKLPTASYGTCPICAGVGVELYNAQTDQLFGASGQWNIRRCTSASCQLLWIDPPPDKDELAASYLRYYTHQVSETNAGWLSHGRAMHLSEHLGYKDAPGTVRDDLIALIRRALPGWRLKVESEVRHLAAVDKGRLLDIGCGSGLWLERMNKLGWCGEGIEWDEQASGVARSRGVVVHVGTLESQRFADNSFDAVTLNHVVEHLVDPVSTLAECFRVLKRQGRLVLYTPNASSLSHLVYGASWRGLEPPRHLQVFTMNAMRSALRGAGFERISVLPWAAPSIVRESHLLWRRRASQIRERPTIALRTYAAAFVALEELLSLIAPRYADCILSIAEK
jgi:2-polyprenyl-3-methyl-5-hydroxy-6-metoxy-1,4-benzoquinol methylase